MLCPTTAIYTDRQLSRRNLPGDNRTRLNSSTSSKYKHNQDHSLTFCPIITLAEFCSSSPFAVLRYILPITD